MSQAEYNFYSKHKDSCWFCKHCKEFAIKCVRADFEIEERCADFMKKYDAKIEEIEGQLAHKVEKAQTDEMERDIEANRLVATGLIEDVKKLADRIDNIVNEPTGMCHYNKRYARN